MAKIAITNIQENENLLKDLSNEEERQIYGGYSNCTPHISNYLHFVISFDNFTVSDTASLELEVIVPVTLTQPLMENG